MKVNENVCCIHCGKQLTTPKIQSKFTKQQKTTIEGRIENFELQVCPDCNAVGLDLSQVAIICDKQYVADEKINQFIHLMKAYEDKKDFVHASLLARLACFRATQLHLDDLANEYRKQSCDYIVSYFENITHFTSDEASLAIVMIDSLRILGEVDLAKEWASQLQEVMDGLYPIPHVQYLKQVVEYEFEWLANQDLNEHFNVEVQ